MGEMWGQALGKVAEKAAPYVLKGARKVGEMLTGVPEKSELKHTLSMQKRNK